jgi:hypothetical protein
MRLCAQLTHLRNKLGCIRLHLEEWEEETKSVRKHANRVIWLVAWGG